MSITLNGTLRNLDKILIVDGYSATGKKLLCLILQTLKRVEKMEMNNFVGDLSCLKLFNKISDDGYEAAIKVHINNTLNNTLLSRATNFRPFDGSSIFNTYNKVKYIKRLFSKEGDYINYYYKKNKPILHLMTHFSYPAINDLNKVLKNKLVFVSMVRHPVYCISHIKYLIKNIHSSNERFNFIGYKQKNGFIPWYMNFEINDKDTFTDQAIKYFLYLDQLDNQADKNLNINKNIFKLPFEHFIMNTKYYVNKITKLLDTEISNNTVKILKKEKLPSKFFSKRTELRTSFRHYVNRDKEETQDVYNKRLNEIKKESSDINFEKFINLLLSYEKKYKINYISSKNFI